MTTEEFDEGFKLRYNNALEGAPGIDAFEVSQYLTNAQWEIVKDNYDIDTDLKSSFELKEKARRILNELVVHETITTVSSSERGLLDSSKFFEYSKQPMYVVLESVKLKSLDEVYDGKVIEVIPITHDEFFRSHRNPFRKPNKNKAWRLDISKENAKTTVEVISEVDVYSYTARYIATPSPIILADLITDDEVGGLGLSIDGKTEKATCVLNTQVHSEIIDRAVELAVLDYRQGDLQSRVALNKRV